MDIISLFASGDSYSSVQRAYSDTHRPSVEHPLGLAFPGSTFNFPDANWVGYLIKKYGPEPRFEPGATPSATYQERPFLVHDYARGGDTVDGIRRQVEKEYLPGVGQKPEWAPWIPEETLFGKSYIFVGASSSLGISYLGRDQRLRVSLAQKTTRKRFNPLKFRPLSSRIYGEAVQAPRESLRHRGAQLSFYRCSDNPPVPGGYDRNVSSEYVADAGLRIVPVKRQEATLLKIEHWNNSLKLAIEAFCKEHPDANAFLWSSFSLFNRLIHYPKQFGFDPKQVRKSRGDFWEDHIHPTKAVHKEIAKDVVAFLKSLSDDGSAVEPETTKGSWIKRTLF